MTFQADCDTQVLSLVGTNGPPPKILPFVRIQPQRHISSNIATIGSVGNIAGMFAVVLFLAATTLSATTYPLQSVGTDLLQLIDGWIAVIIGESSTWWLLPQLPLRTYMERRNHLSSPVLREEISCNVFAGDKAMCLMVARRNDAGSFITKTQLFGLNIQTYLCLVGFAIQKQNKCTYLHAS